MADVMRPTPDLRRECPAPAAEVPVRLAWYAAEDVPGRRPVRTLASTAEVRIEGGGDAIRIAGEPDVYVRIALDDDLARLLASCADRPDALLIVRPGALNMWAEVAISAREFIKVVDRFAPEFRAQPRPAPGSAFGMGG